MPITALTELETVEVSLVPAGANLKKRFPIMKRNEESSMSDILHAVIDAHTSEDSHFENVVKSADLSEEAAMAVKGAMKILNAYADTIPADQALAVIGKGLGVKQTDPEVAKEEDEEEEESAEEVQALAEMITEAEETGADEEEDPEVAKEDDEEAEKEEDPEVAKEDDDDEAEKEDDSKEKMYEEKEDEEDEAEKTALQKSLKSLDPAIRAQVQALWKSQKTAVEKSKKLERSLAVERDDRIRKEFVAKANKDFRFVPGKSPDELGLMLKALHSLDSQIAKDIEGIFKSVSAVMEKGDLLGEIGSSMTGEGDAGSAFSKLDNLAKSRVKKSGESYARSFEKEMRSNPDLYTAYLNEQAK